MNLKPNFKVVDKTWRNEPQQLEIRINPGCRGFPMFLARSYDGKITKVTIEAFPFVKNKRQYMTYIDRLEQGLNQWLSNIMVIESFQNPLDLIRWLRTTNIEVAENIYVFEEMKLKSWERQAILSPVEVP